MYRYFKDRRVGQSLLKFFAVFHPSVILACQKVVSSNSPAVTAIMHESRWRLILLLAMAESLRELDFATVRKDVNLRLLVVSKI